MPSNEIPLSTILSEAYGIACEQTMQSVELGDDDGALSRAESADLFAEMAQEYGATEEQITGAIRTPNL